MKKSAFCALFILVISAGLCLAQSEQPSLGDLARQRRNEKEKKTAKTFTNEDVATTHPSAAGGGSASAPVTAKAAADSTPAKSDARAESRKAEPDAASSKDRPEVVELKSKISSYKAEQDGWKRSAKRYEELLAKETDDFRRQMYQDALEGDRNNIQVYQNRIDQTEAELAKAQSGH